jgi:uncharacterized protein (DUF983 family)
MGQSSASGPKGSGSPLKLALSTRHWREQNQLLLVAEIQRGRGLLRNNAAAMWFCRMTYNETTNPVLTGIRGRCPRCQQGHLFSTYLKLARRCEVCGLNFSFADPADGPAFFSMSIVAFPALAFALWFQLTYEPSYWMHALTTLPLTVGACVALLRPLKGWLVCSQYFHKAEEGSIDREWHAAEAERQRQQPPNT